MSTDNKPPATHPAQTNPDTGQFHLALWLTALAALAFGIWLRLDQIFAQVLIDDEWHAVHQLLKSTPDRIALSFGYADYSIPLTLLYWWEAATFGLSEWMMRWPMALAGMASLFFLPWITARRLNQFTAVAFLLLLAMSPLLIAFSQKARPYALNVLLVWLSVWLFYRYCDAPRQRRWWLGLAYALVSALAVWTHLIVALFIAAPFVLEGLRLFRLPKSERKKHFLCLLSLALPAGALTLALTLPPLLHDAGSLLSKTHKHQVSLDTLIGAWHLWTGTASAWLAALTFFLSAIGLFRILHRFPEARAILAGLLMTLILVIVTQPAWINHPLVVARYLLPALPLALLGLAAAWDGLRQRTHPILAWFILAALATGLFYTSPLPALLKRPLSNKSHTALIYEFRPGKNEALDYMLQRPLSPFWKQLAHQPGGSQTVAVAPFAFESFHWDAIFWEPASGQRVIPGYLLGLCADTRHGEVPDNHRFRFANVAYLARPEDLKKRGVTLVLWQKPARFGKASSMTHKKLAGCGEKIRALYGAPVYEDDKIAVYPVNRTDTRLNPLPKKSAADD